jgi:hypothetical protein
VYEALSYQCISRFYLPLWKHFRLLHHLHHLRHLRHLPDNSDPPLSSRYSVHLLCWYKRYEYWYIRFEY